MDITTVGRPRNVGWIRAAGILYGDWGTSKAYVLGIGLSLVGFAVLPYALAVCALTGLVGLGYMLVCRLFPQGGGVYASARLLSPRLAMVGALLLIADYLVTASLSCLDAFRYLGVTSIQARDYAIVAIIVVGILNSMGPKHMGSAAVWLALPAAACVVVIIVGGLPHLGEFRVEVSHQPAWDQWANFVGMILALSGVEAIANLTGVMKLNPGATRARPAVTRTSSRALLAVMADVVVGTAILAVLVQCLPAEAKAHTDDLLRYMATYFVGEWFGFVVGIVFALLLVSAVNTAINGMVAVLYLMAREEELPASFTWLNTYGVPWVPLILATALPSFILLAVPTVGGLASLYAIGVVGAITITLTSCAWNRQLKLRRYERFFLGGAGILLALVWLTIAISKFEAAVFAGGVVVVGLGLREFTRWRRTRYRIEGAEWIAPPVAEAKHSVEPPVDEAAGKLAPMSSAEAQTAPTGPAVLVVARRHSPAVEFALAAAVRRNAHLTLMYLRELPVGAAAHSTRNRPVDPEAIEFFEAAAHAVQPLHLHPVYACTDEPAETIVDTARETGAEIVYLCGAHHPFIKVLLRGNLVYALSQQLPMSVRLIYIR